MQTPPTGRGIYIHIPFCIKKCYYCDFYSLPVHPGDSVFERYTRALLAEIIQKAETFPDTVMNSIYLGGGTPSLLETDDLKKIIDVLYKNFSSTGSGEITLEANPATLSEEKIKAIQAAGVTRLSLGVQSFDDEELRILGRIHNAAQVVETVQLLHKTGFNNYNIDLIYGVPGQTIHSWEKSLNKAIDCSPEHISIYLLQLDDSTPMARQIKSGLLPPADDDRDADMYEMSMNLLAQAGYEHYEISNFARQGCQCQHNLWYWQAREYLGIGAGAVSCTGRQRYINQPNLPGYMEAFERGSAAEVKLLETMDVEQSRADAIILGLRLCEGIDRKVFKERFGVDVFASYRDILEPYLEAGILNLTEGRLSFSKSGYFVSNQVLCRFMGR